MGLTVAEAFILLAFCLLLLFTYWQAKADEEKEILRQEKEEIIASYGNLTRDQQAELMAAFEDGRMEALITIEKAGVDIREAVKAIEPEEFTRFIQEEQLQRILAGAAKLDEETLVDLSELVEIGKNDMIMRALAAAESEYLENIEALRTNPKLAALMEEAAELEPRMLETLSKVVEMDEKMLTRALVAASKEEDGADQRLADISEVLVRAEQEQRALTGAIRDELGDLVSEIGGHIEPDGSIVLPEGVVFERGEDQITPRLRTFLSAACAPWLEVLKSSGLNIASVQIEGHASSEWSRTSTTDEAYRNNLDLSQRRSQNVLNACLDFVDSEDTQRWAQAHLVAIGYSSGKPVLTEDGLEDAARSRRVVFSAALDREKVLEEIEKETALSPNGADAGTNASPDVTDTGQETASIETSATNPLDAIAQEALQKNNFDDRTRGQADVIGIASVVDGDTIEIHGQRIRLHGIDAPESSQPCRNAEGNGYRCGQLAANQLDTLIGGSSVKCWTQDVDRYRRLVSVCELGNIDINAWMVEQGLAVAYRKYSMDYAALEDDARKGRVGIWGGRFQMPWDYRK
ncbi:Succinoglycan biosynthesis protein ExoI [Roseovarius sp. THAF8]|nr:Succinoglycan biosynthesis protein ExoI [Roseovarius sp. THAF8]